MSRFATESPRIASFMSDSPDYQALSSASQKTRAEERSNLAYETAKIHGSGLQAQARVAAADYEGQAMLAGAQASAAASTAQGWSSFAGGIAGGISNLDFGGGINDYTSPTARMNVDAGYSPGLGIPIDDYLTYGE